MQQRNALRAQINYEHNSLWAQFTVLLLRAPFKKRIARKPISHDSTIPMSLLDP